MTPTLWMHLARRFAIYWAVVLLVICILCTTLKLVESSRAFVSQGAKAELLFYLALCIALELGHRLLFVAMLLGLVLLGHRMAQDGELVGLMAQGLRPRQLMAPLMIVVVVATGAAVLVADRVLPWTMATRTTLLARDLGKVEPATLYFQKRSAWYFEGDCLYHLPHVLADNTGFSQPTVHILDGDVLAWTLDAQSVTFVAGAGWVMHQGAAYSARTADYMIYDHRPLPLQVSPQALLNHVGNPRELPHRAAQGLIARRRSSGLDTTVHRLEVQERITQPLCAPLLLLAALPWAMNPDRRRPLGLALCAAVGAVAVVLTFGQVFRLLSLAHKLPVAWGASGQLVCAVLAFGLTLIVPRGWASYR